jgi:hypothetical protein
VFEQHLLQDVEWKSDCFAQDSVGDWRLCLPVEQAVSQTAALKEAVGLDLGLKDTVATSDGKKLEAGHFYRPPPSQTSSRCEAWDLRAESCGMSTGRTTDILCGRIAAFGSQ